jgi:tetratricopeptide (TPR) repeat protein
MMAKAWNNKGIAPGMQGKCDDALKAFDEAIRLDPNLAEAWYIKGEALESFGRNIDTQEAYAKAKELGYTG